MNILFSLKKRTKVKLSNDALLQLNSPLVRAKGIVIPVSDIVPMEHYKSSFTV